MFTSRSWDKRGRATERLRIGNTFWGLLGIYISLLNYFHTHTHKHTPGIKGKKSLRKRQLQHNTLESGTFFFQLFSFFLSISIFSNDSHFLSLAVFFFFWGGGRGGSLFQCAGCLLQHALAVTAELSCPVACGILVPQRGIEPVSPALEGIFLTTEPPGKSLSQVLII